MAFSVSLKQFSGLFRRRLTLTQELAEVYRPSLNRQKDKLIELIKEKAEIASQSPIARKLRDLKGFYTLEMAPPGTPQEISQMKDDIMLIQKFIKEGCFKFLTIRQIWLLFLVFTEVCLWFYLGETIGKMHIVGYNVH